MCPCIPDRIGIWQCWLVFEERGKPEYPEKNLAEQGEKQQQTKSTYDTAIGNRIRGTYICGRRVFSPLRHPMKGSVCYNELNKEFV